MGRRGPEPSAPSPCRGAGASGRAATARPRPTLRPCTIAAGTRGGYRCCGPARCGAWTPPGPTRRCSTTSCAPGCTTRPGRARRCRHLLRVPVVLPRPRAGLRGRRAISAYAPEAQRALEQGLQDVLPGMVGEGPGELSLSTLAAAAGPVAGLGGLGVLYSGLSWISSMRSALQSMFDTPTADRPGLVAGYARDLAALLVIGVVLVLSVVVTGLVTGFSERIAGLIGLGAGLAWMLTGLSVALGLVANALLFVAMFRLLAEPRVGAAAVWSGALLGGAGFELLKQASAWLLASTTRLPAFQAFGIALILLVWISYFSRIVMFAAAWARTWGAVPPGAGGPTPGR
ncbi:YihY/virulence factor BrkB family protein [Agilicoccus flavus]|uniref:YihY/virulence factor BrkB family protein n=1 Tax=Agilicoccus flavus TaxID=2775968 RepID=UPI001CF645AD